MRFLFRKLIRNHKTPEIYWLYRFWRAVKMDRITHSLSRSQLKFFLFIFVISGTVCCFYTALGGILMDRSESIAIERISVIKPVSSNQEYHFLDISLKKGQKQSDLSRSIDSILNVSGSMNLHKNYNSHTADF